MAILYDVGQVAALQREPW